MTVTYSEIRPGDILRDTNEVVREVRRQGADVVLVLTDGTTVVGDAEDIEEVLRDG